MKLIWRGIKGFGAFWVDFLIGDSPEIAVGVVIILVIGILLHSNAMLMAFVIPIAVISLLVFSLFLGKKRGD
jgi:hypothetical protein